MLCRPGVCGVQEQGNIAQTTALKEGDGPQQLNPPLRKQTLPLVRRVVTKAETPAAVATGLGTVCEWKKTLFSHKNNMPRSKDSRSGCSECGASNSTFQHTKHCVGRPL